MDIGTAYALIGGSIYAAIQWPAIWVWAIAIVVVGTQQYALHIIQHDGLHGRLFSGKRVNDLLCRLLLSYLLLSPFSALRQKHLAHHNHLGTVSDPDRYYHVTLGKHTRARYLLFVSAFGAAIATVLRARGPKTSNRERGGMVADLFLTIIVQIALGLGLAQVGPWYTYLALWLLPYALGVFVCQNLRSFAEHAQPEPDHLADAHRAITYTSNRIERLFLAPCNMNYHAEHHLYPAVPYYHLPALRRHLEVEGAMDDVEYRRSYVGFLIRFWLTLPIIVRIGPETSADVTKAAVSSNM